MSLINRMLRDLDARAAAPDAPVFAQYLRPVGRRGANESAGHRDSYWRFAWGGMYAFTGIALLSFLGTLLQGPVAPEIISTTAPTTAPAATAVLATEQRSVVEFPADLPPLAEPPVAADAASSNKPVVAMLGSSVDAARSSHQMKAASVAAPVASRAVAPVVVPQSTSRAEAKDVRVRADDTHIDKQMSPRAHAENELRRGMTLLNRGRAEAAIDAFKSSLNADPLFVTARQTLIAVLAEQGRRPEAEAVAREGLRLDQDNANLAMIAARLSLDRGDPADALLTLEQHAGAATGNGDYRAFAGALYYRAGRYREAAQEYTGAVQIVPRNGTWWMGLAMAQEAMSRRDEALTAYRQARASGTLGADLDAYVAERVRALQ